MLSSEEIVIEGKKFTGIKIEMPNATLLVIVSNEKKCFLACGYFSREACEKFGDVCAIVTGVKSFQEMLAKEVVWVSSRAKEKGAREKMKGKEFLSLF